MKERVGETEGGTNAPLPLFIYTPKDSRLRFLAPKHTSRLLFPSEVPHSTERLGDRAEASWGQNTSVHPPSLYTTFHTLAASASTERCVDVWQGHVLICSKNINVHVCWDVLGEKTAQYVCLYNLGSVVRVCMCETESVFPHLPLSRRCQGIQRLLMLIMRRET